LGISQRRLAGLVGQSQSEISEVLAGRQVGQYDVLTRIADGLGVPRGLMGLAYCADGGLSIADLPASPPPPVPAREPEPPRAVMVTTVPVCTRCCAEPTVTAWSGVEVRALRGAMRLSVRGFARYLGVSDRQISKWESGSRPGPVNTSALDTCLILADAATRRRFAVSLAVATLEP
jgi:transcriptional regulator with XRE-family HTH domain